MINKVLDAIKKFSLIQKGDDVTVALSGGADSVSLLYALLSIKDELGITVNAAHLNHLIRGDEAERDQKFVTDLCEKLGVTLFCEKADVPKIAKENGISLELAARQVRYEFLERVATGKVATAHTASDNLETMIFNLARGTSLKGLCGIPTKRGIFIRPLILCTRQNVEDYCKQNNLSFVTDSTNLCDDYSRNKIRHNVIPVLKGINSSVEESALRTSQSLMEDNSYLENISEEILFKNLCDNGLSVKDCENIAPAIFKRVIKRNFEILFPEIMLDSRHINDIYSICLCGVGKINLPSNVYAVVKNGYLSYEDEEIKNTVNFAVKVTENENVNNLFSNNVIDCDKIIGKWILRTRLEGDKIRLYKRGVTKTLKKLFTENKVPNELRDKIPVIADEKGVIWVYGMGVCERVAVTKNTKKILEVEVQKL
jgi:tRNA(Ile)-lysidine synthase